VAVPCQHGEVAHLVKRLTPTSCGTVRVARHLRHLEQVFS
jgi:hypothetical protein